MIGFLSILGEFLLAVWSRTWRWTFRRPRNLATTTGAVFLGVIVWIAMQPAAVAPTATAPTAAAPEGPVYSTVTAEPIAPDAAPTPTRPNPAGSSVAASETAPTLGAGPHAPDTQNVPKLDSHEPASIPAPTAPTVDRKKAQSVAKAWATAYHSRASDAGDEWKKTIAPYTTPALLTDLENMAFAGKSPLKGKSPTQVTEVRIAAAGESSLPDTKVRWSRNLAVSVLAGDGSTTTITYTVTAALSEQGWTMTDAIERFWTAK